MSAVADHAAAHGHRNLIEPAALPRQFLALPPFDFLALEVAGVPAFSTVFDLTTTLEPRLRNKLLTLPGWPLIGRWLRMPACFVGTTVTEYALLPAALPPAAFVDALLRTARGYPMLIIKDLPTAGPLIGDEDIRYALALTEACLRAGFMLVEGQALAYVPIDFSSVREFIARMPRTRRKDLQRKLRSRAALAVETVPTGAASFQDDALLDEMYALYHDVYRQSEIHFDLLSRDFFRAVLQDAGSGGIVFFYRGGGQLIGYNLCFETGGMLLDKYVGFRYPQAREYNLYAVSWVHNLDYAAARGLSHYVAGWTDPEVKRHLGARFTLTRHAVYFRNPVLRHLLRPFRRFFEADARWQQQVR